MPQKPSIPHNSASPEKQKRSSTAHKRTPLQRLKDLETIAELTLQGVKQSEIAAQLNLSQPQIVYDLRDIKKKWQEKSTMKIEEYIAQEIAELDLIRAELWAGWQRSKVPRKNTSASIRERGDGALSEKEAKEETRDGNPRFLENILFVQERRSRLLGLDKPFRANVTELFVQPDSLNDEQIERILAGESLESVVAASSFQQQSGVAQRRDSGEAQTPKAKKRNAARPSHRRKRS